MSARAVTGFALIIALATGANSSDSSSLFQAVEASREHTVFALAAVEGKERDVLNGNTEYTLFAPTDTAFRALPTSEIKALATDKAALTGLIRSHLVPGKISVAELRKSDGGTLRTLAGTRLKVSVTPDAVTVGGAKLVSTESRCSNGILHFTAAVLPISKE